MKDSDLRVLVKDMVHRIQILEAKKHPKKCECSICSEYAPDKQAVKSAEDTMRLSRIKKELGIE
jgi:hypothetical protein